MTPADRAAAVQRMGVAPTFTAGRWTFDTTPAADRVDAVQTALFDGIAEPSLF